MCTGLTGEPIVDIASRATVPADSRLWDCQSCFCSARPDKDGGTMDNIVRTRKTRVISLLGMLGLLAGMLALTIGPALAAFPGTNGKITFESNRDGNNEIYVMNADGSGQMNLTNNGADDVQPAFSPDGTKIAFASTR